MLLRGSPTALAQTITLLFSLLGNTTAWAVNPFQTLNQFSQNAAFGQRPGFQQLGVPQSFQNGQNGFQPGMGQQYSAQPDMGQQQLGTGQQYGSQPGAQSGMNPQYGSQSGQPATTGGSASTFPSRFSSQAAQKFYVDGKTLPFVEFDAGPSYAGLIPLSSDPNEKRKFFFWFWPAAQAVGANDLTFWTNGGPGCSSLESLLQETGPISWKFGQARPTQNQYSWTNATSMLYVEHPIGTGYSVGTPTATNQTDVSRDLFNFFTQWLQVFPEMNGKNFWLSGESYAGFYVPYLADYIYSYQSNLNLKLMGMYLVNPTLSWTVLHEQMPIFPLVKRYEHVFALNETFMSTISRLHQECGYADYLAKYEVYPPPRGPFPAPEVGFYMEHQQSNSSCDTFNMVYEAAKLANPGK
ncbi:uncharacterized protein PGTG_21811 [Puccinia graminis f. sp. tritici CRL 75-36-700-3]|uniref:Carboxypeptidase n=1 Tax=Puccinia graminis f. sp. tritici (strain CRL 75-36-700-3 / race SCCL) TaxID=418459 RepID=H6QSQ4_PUCGT|nr:uncharacterized protein PGTG_21811 [Puccinia graminis f. sp. tritici CRL 75-36-700-3]EHS63794.1 hypothetical protein PGTG_21811 [Puccinia graminis f. sp. tritici CRL 75-36-700-3]